VVTAVLPYELIAQHVPLSPEWHATRTLGLGGSEIAAVLGLSKYESAFSLWHRKAGGIIPESDNPAMEWGRRLEGVVAAKFAENHPDLALVNTPGTYRNRERTWQIANPDGVLFDDDRPFPLAPVAIYEGKTARYDYEWGTPGTDEIPVPYLVQVRWYMDVFGVDTCQDFAAVLPSHVKPETWVRLAVGALRRDPKLAQAASNDLAALMGALLTAARLGLEPGTEQFYLVPRKDKGTMKVAGQIGYQGQIELIYRAGAVSSVIVEVVREKDVFEYAPGRDERPRHIIDWDAEDRGPLRLVYAYAVMKDGATSKVIVLNKGHIATAKASSQGADSEYSPWKKHEEAMWMKTAAHRLAKWVPTSASTCASRSAPLPTRPASMSRCRLTCLPSLPAWMTARARSSTGNSSRPTLPPLTCGPVSRHDRPQADRRRSRARVHRRRHRR
jgi:phage RecT family recombinase